MAQKTTIKTAPGESVGDKLPDLYTLRLDADARSCVGAVIEKYSSPVSRLKPTTAVQFLVAEGCKRFRESKGKGGK